MKHTPLLEVHRSLGARLVPFAGFEMPVQYASIVQEHAAVRERAGLFDVSHMGQIHLDGPGAVRSVERLVTCPVADLAPGRVRYGCLCHEHGGVVDDVTVYREADDALFLCVNAANIEKDYRWIVRHAEADASVRDRSDETGLLALQGPLARDVLAAVCDGELPRIGRFRFAEASLAGAPTRVSHTGYTGSDGYELYCAADHVEKLWKALLAAGEPHDLLPAGLGARDTLRLEAALALYGHELDDDTTPLEAGLRRFVKLEEGGFLGDQALRAQDARGLERSLVGFVVEGRGIARAGYPLAYQGEEVGRVTSGSPSPTLGKPIGLGYVPPRLARTGTSLEVIVRGNPVAIRVVETPFVSKG